MKGRGGRGLFLGIQWDAESWDDAPLWCDFLFDRLEGIPLHWNFPALPQDGGHRKRAGFLRLLKQRIESCSDVVAPMGFAGAGNPFLTREELEREISWALQNPWGTGVQESLGVRPTTFMPRLPDERRPFALEMYRQHGFRRVGYPSAGPFTREDHEGIEFFPYERLELRTPAQAEWEKKRLQRLIESRESRFVALDLSGISSLAPLRGAAEEIVTLLRGCMDEISTIDQAAEEGTATDGGDGGGARTVEQAAARRPSPMALGGSSAIPGARRPCPSMDWSLFPAAAFRAKLAATARLTVKRSRRSEDFQKVLSALAPGPAPDYKACEFPGSTGDDKALVAQMNGETTLKGPDFDVKLVGGRFCGILRGKESLLIRKPAVSRIRIDGKTLRFRGRGSISFESEAGAGLREDLALEGSLNGTLAVEYSFRNDLPGLCITVDICFPPTKDSSTIEEYRPFAFLLVNLPDTPDAAIEAIAPDGSSASYPLSRLDECAPIPGAMHRIALPGGGAVTLQCGEAGAWGWGLPYFRIVRSLTGRAMLEVNPFGSGAPFPASLLSGARKKHVLLLGFEERVGEGAPPLKKAQEPSSPHSVKRSGASKPVKRSGASKPVKPSQPKKR